MHIPADEKTKCHALCQSRRYDIGEGRCALICLDQLGSPRDKPGGCPHAERIFASLVAVRKAKQPTHCKRCNDEGWLPAIEGRDGSYITSRPCGCKKGFEVSNLSKK